MKEKQHSVSAEKCVNCGDVITAEMCQQGQLIDGEWYPFHVGCADAWFSEEIDVWKITSPGNGHYIEEFPENVAEMIKEMDDESEYVIRKQRMARGKYLALAEFTGF